MARHFYRPRETFYISLKQLYIERNAPSKSRITLMPLLCVVEWNAIITLFFFLILSTKKANAKKPPAVCDQSIYAALDFLSLIHAAADHALLFHFGTRSLRR